MNKRVVITDQRWAPLFCNWLQEHIGEPGVFEPSECRTVAHVLFHDDGRHEILAVVGLNRWTTHTVDGNIASDGTKRWASREFLWTVYDYAFRHADKSRMNFAVRPENAAAIKLHERLGHQFEYRLADGNGEGNDILLYGLTRRSWRVGPWAHPARTKAHGPVNSQHSVETA